jgi:hypothetical protein
MFLVCERVSADLIALDLTRGTVEDALPGEAYLARFARGPGFDAGARTGCAAVVLVGEGVDAEA